MCICLGKINTRLKKVEPFLVYLTSILQINLFFDTLVSDSLARVC